MSRYRVLGVANGLAQPDPTVDRVSALRPVVGRLVQVAGRVVGRELDAERHRELIDDYIDELSQGVSANGGSEGDGRGRG